MSRHRKKKASSVAASSREAAGTAADDGYGEGEDEEEAGIDLEPEYEVVDVMAKIPKTFTTDSVLSKWKDRKEALDDLHAAITTLRSLKDLLMTSYALGEVSERCEIFAVCELSRRVASSFFAKDSKEVSPSTGSTIIGPLMEKLKEKKASVVEALGGASFESLSEELDATRRESHNRDIRHLFLNFARARMMSSKGPSAILGWLMAACRSSRASFRSFHLEEPSRS